MVRMIMKYNVILVGKSLNKLNDHAYSPPIISFYVVNRKIVNKKTLHDQSFISTTKNTITPTNENRWKSVGIGL